MRRFIACFAVLAVIGPGLTNVGLPGASSLHAQVVVEKFSRGRLKHPMPNVLSHTEDEHQLPSITYGASRSSKAWANTKDGTRVAIDDGIEYDGMTYYLGLTWHLVAVDNKTGKTAWSHNVSAFWNKLAIEKIESDDGKSTVVALRSGREDETSTHVEYYNLKTGKRLETDKEDLSALGVPIKVRQTYSGNVAANSKKIWQLVTSEEQWYQVHDRVFDGIERAPALQDMFDPDSEVLLIIASGDSYNCSGISLSGVFENDQRMLIRIHYRTYQSSGETPVVRPYGVFVLPKAKSGKYQIYRNAQRFIGGPAIWQPVKEFQ